ncbi:MAG TPA: hypothetical protein VNV85_06235 [Puia sp.]|jgi:hypothetical protein|nr:hypothetical protein [Puia sp.]
MNNVLKQLSLFVFFIFPVVLQAQRISYSEPQREDGRRTDFEIIGKIDGNFLVFTNNRSDNNISIFDDDMKLLNRVPLDFLPDKYINAYFIPYPDFFYMIYEYQKKNIVHCAAVKINGQGKNLSQPIDLDTTQIGFAASNKIYTTVSSDDKQKIMVFKINSKNAKNFLFTTFLYNQQLELIDRHRLYMPMEEHNESFTDFLLDNEGTLVFAKFLRNSSADYVSKVSIATKDATADNFSINDIGNGDHILDELKIKVDNNNKNYILTGFYYKQKKGNIEGLYSMVWDKATNTKLKESLNVFSDELRAVAKSSEANLKMAFNDFFINQIIIKKDGGFLLVSESQFTTSRGGYFNRWDYMYGYNPYLSPMDYYGYPYYSPWNRYGYNNPNAVRYHSENIMILSFDKDCKLEWSNVIPKSQFDDESENLISNHIMNTGGELHFLYNQYEHKNILLADQSVSPEGKITRYPTLKNLDRGYDFMPRYGKQVSARQMIVPCLYKNYLCFAKIDF